MLNYNMEKTIANLVVSTRIRLARNIEKLPFKTRQVDVFENVADTIKNNNKGLMSARISNLDKATATALFEQHLISRDILSNRANGLIVLNDDKTSRVCVMLGEEDHIRIQVIHQGFNLAGTYEKAKKISTDIEKEHMIAKSKTLGYLTSCPTNLGTGMRASVMLFLPALTLTGQIQAVVARLSQMRVTVRGVYGEGSSATGYMYQISNQATLGLTEEQILKKVEQACTAVIDMENKLQQELLKTQGDVIVDQVMRSLGTLTHAHMISSEEATEKLAWLKLGDCLGIVKFKPRSLDDLFFIIQPATLTTQERNASNIGVRDKLRAKKIAEVIRLSKMG